MPDKFSRRAIECLFARFPEWRQYCHEEIADEGKSYFVVEVPTSKEAGVSGPLLITTCDEEVTVGFDHYHAHYDEMTDINELQDNTAMGFILELLSEHIAVMSLWNGDEFKGSGILKLGEDPKHGWPKIRYDRIRIRSWFGTLNKDCRV